jgi:hypothetical protein
VLVVLLSPAFYRSRPCLIEMSKAVRAKKKIVPLRCEEPLPTKDAQWLDVAEEEVYLLDEV